MARPARIAFPGGLYQGISRGKEHKPMVRRVEKYSGRDASRWQPGSRSDNSAYVDAPNHFKYTASRPAKKLT